MRLLVLTLLAVLMLPFVPSRADEVTGHFMEMVGETSENNKLFDLTMRTCLAEMANGTIPQVGDAEKAFQDCIASKGISVTLSPVDDGRTPVYQMGRGRDTPSVLTYQIPQKDALLQRLQGKTAATDMAVPRTQEAGQTGETAQTPPAAGENTQNSTSARPKIYLPSRDSGDSPKPIFLKR